jgi:NAD-dependent deacetylase
MHFSSTDRLVVLTGAGVSAESGIPTFRSSDGLWENEPVEAVATPEGFAKDPERVIRFYNERRRAAKAAQPNPAHIALARLEEALGDRFLLVTQNVDDLHQRAGNKRLIAMHGELMKARCLGSAEHVFECPGDQPPACPVCGAKVRPHIVWFGEVPFAMDEIQEALLRCTHFAYIGTSSVVYPAAGFKEIARAHGAKVICFNLEGQGGMASEEFHAGKAGETVPRWADEFTPPQ